jgi:hypothetical protein
MDHAKRGLLEQHLAEAERHVAESETRLGHQRASIEERQRDGHDVGLAETLLAEMEQTYRMQLADRERLRHELSELRRQEAG